MKFTRGQITQYVAITLGLLWVILMATVQNEYFNQILQTLPSFILVSFGSYAVYSIGRDLSILKDYPEEHKSLVKEIDQANKYYETNKVYLRK